MKKKGFTLVELLAVIAILAILVIMALPAVLRMFQQARIDSFNNELNTIIRTARQQYLLGGGEAQTWTNVSDSTSKLELTGSSDLIYLVEMNGLGQIIKLQATNGEYQYDKSESDGIDIANKSDIQVISNLNSNEVLVIDAISGSNYVYYAGTSDINIGSSLPNGTYNNYQDAVNAFGHPFFLRLTTDNNIITETHIGFIMNGNDYYVKVGDGGASFQSNKEEVISAFTCANCIDCERDDEIECNLNNIGVRVYSNGSDIKVSSPTSSHDDYACAYSGGSSICYDNPYN